MEIIWGQYPGCVFNLFICVLQLKFLSYEELQQRMANLDAEMEREIDELRRRYQTKRQPILDAMDQKRKRQQNFWEQKPGCLAGSSRHSGQTRCSLRPAIPPHCCYREMFWYQQISINFGLEWLRSNIFLTESKPYVLHRMDWWKQQFCGHGLKLDHSGQLVLSAWSRSIRYCICSSNTFERVSISNSCYILPPLRWNL